VTPEELAAKHPRLYHVTDPANWEGIQKHGLLSTSRILTKREISDEERACINRRRQRESVPLKHPIHGEVVIRDNRPLNETKLWNCLDDGLTPADWLALLDERVFFWVDETRIPGFMKPYLKNGVDQLVLVLDTLSVARSHGDRMELCPFNSGSTYYDAPRRGLATFTPLLRHDYPTWQKLRANVKESRDYIVEVTVVGGVDPITDHVIGRYLVSAADGRWISLPLM
jgi:hypothetical protein